MLFTEVATGRMNCRGGKKVALEDSGRVILGPWREKVSQQKTKLICCQGVQHGKKRHAQQWCLIVLFILAALSVVRQKKSPVLSQLMQTQRSFGLPGPMAPLKLIPYVC